MSERQPWSDERLDEVAAGLSLFDVPPELSARTLAAMRRESRPQRPWLGAVWALAAVALLFVAPWPDPPPDVSRMSEKGAGVRLPAVDLKIAVKRGDRLERLSTRRANPEGTVLFFRAAVDGPARLSLLRVDQREATVVHQQVLAAGEADLGREGHPLAWHIDPGEGSAVFALVASPEGDASRSIEPDLLQTLPSLYNGDDTSALCDAFAMHGARCSALHVQVSPP